MNITTILGFLFDYIEYSTKYIRGPVKFSPADVRIYLLKLDGA